MILHMVITLWLGYLYIFNFGHSFTFTAMLCMYVYLPHFDDLQGCIVFMSYST